MEAGKIAAAAGEANSLANLHLHDNGFFDPLDDAASGSKEEKLYEAQHPLRAAAVVTRRCRGRPKKGQQKVKTISEPKTEDAAAEGRPRRKTTLPSRFRDSVAGEAFEQLVDGAATADAATADAATAEPSIVVAAEDQPLPPAQLPLSINIEILEQDGNFILRGIDSLSNIKALDSIKQQQTLLLPQTSMFVTAKDSGNFLMGAADAQGLEFSSIKMDEITHNFTSIKMDEISEHNLSSIKMDEISEHNLSSIKVDEITHHNLASIKMDEIPQHDHYAGIPDAMRTNDVNFGYPVLPSTSVVGINYAVMLPSALNDGMQRTQSSQGDFHQQQQSSQGDFMQEQQSSQGDFMQEQQSSQGDFMQEQQSSQGDFMQEQQSSQENFLHQQESSQRDFLQQQQSSQASFMHQQPSQVNFLQSSQGNATQQQERSSFLDTSCLVEPLSLLSTELQNPHFQDNKLDLHHSESEIGEFSYEDQALSQHLHKTTSQTQRLTVKPPLLQAPAQGAQGGKAAACKDEDLSKAPQLRVPGPIRVPGPRRKARHKCPICAKLFVKEGRFRNHVAKHGAALVQCLDCKQKFTSQKLLYVHQQEHHHSGVGIVEAGAGGGRSVDTKLHCKKCPDERFTSVADYESHINTAHTGALRRHACPLCDKKFLYDYSLRSHTELCHTQPDQESCGSGMWRRHTCPECGEVFRHLSSLAYHRESCHTSGRVFVCATCGVVFKHRQLLQRHAAVHSHLRPYKFRDSVAGEAFEQLVDGAATADAATADAATAEPSIVVAAEDQPLPPAQLPLSINIEILEQGDLGEG
ncbi:uncharacterized protein LOC108681836 [Hyalella azteca]|uniref:Uncharacterized protein LOC108681836 n=1 Tax=Hyalella azteca TaxID=294128 RepID=A0A8B7PLX6_HYAAZ|nr:uncharacterized protein LOC108681836 [Hyalella azteca]